MKFILFVEGHTEAEGKRLSAYLKKWLDPQLREPVGIPPIRFDGWSELVKDAPIKAKMHLEGPRSSEIIGIIGLIDLFGPDVYPPGAVTPQDRFDWIKRYIEDRVKQPTYRQFCAVHDVEAWLLSQPSLFPRAVRDAFPANVAQPERVNFGEPPAYLLTRLYRHHAGRSYKKRVDGPNLFDKADPNVAYAKCPFLRQMLDEMLSMARAVGL